MKKKLRFDLNGIESLRDLFLTGIRAYATNAEFTGGMINVIWCFLCDGSVLRIQSRMNDLAEWEEVGTLVFRLVGVGEKIAPPVDLSNPWQNISCVEMLVVDEPEFSAESGLVLRNCAGDEFTIVCGADVCAVQIQAPFYSGGFLPEYDVETYVRRILH
jgi:hypothetical protein